MQGVPWRQRFAPLPAPDGYFLRAGFQAHFASLLDARSEDPDFTMWGDDPYAAYGGRSLHTRSHGEAFLAILQNRIRRGLFLFDEPESALSPQRQLVLLAHMATMAATGNAQFIVATHSPVLLTFPAARILSFDGEAISEISLEETSHDQITGGSCRIRSRIGNIFSQWRSRRDPRRTGDDRRAEKKDRGG